MLLGQRKLNIYHKEKLDVKASKSAAGIREVIKEALNNENLKKKAEALRKDFHASGGYKTAADFIEKMV